MGKASDSFYYIIRKGLRIGYTLGPFCCNYCVDSLL